MVVAGNDPGPVGCERHACDAFKDAVVRHSGVERIGRGVSPRRECSHDLRRPRDAAKADNIAPRAGDQATIGRKLDITDRPMMNLARNSIWTLASSQSATRPPFSPQCNFVPSGENETVLILPC